MLSDRLLALVRNPETPSFALRDAVMEEGGPVPSVFVVAGVTGEYSDLRAWTVAAFLDRAHADAFCARLTAWCTANGVQWWDNIGPRPTRPGWPEFDRLAHPDDPGFECDRSTGTLYTVDEIPLRVEEPPQ